MKPIIKIENLGKQYRLGYIGTGTLSHDLNRWWHKIRGKEDPYLKIGEVNNTSTKPKSQYVWSLQNINIEVMPGEVLGIIGKNGAGKSSLLKILSRITAPTKGYIKTRGRIASLLEVGTGFHPELTGRENIFLNGAILGMTKPEIKDKFNEIVNFAGCERYLDTPVKRYSSGMYVRLAFAVAAHLEPEILVVDEVLAVGDAEFQRKAIGKMQDASSKHGRTVLFVSHNMNAIKSLCTRAIVLDQGKICYVGTPEDCVNHYLNMDSLNEEKIISAISFRKSFINISSIKINGYEQNFFQLNAKDSGLFIEIEGMLTGNMIVSTELLIYDSNQNNVAFYSPGVTKGFFSNHKMGKFKISEKISFPKNMLSGNYYFDLNLLDHNLDAHIKAPKCFSIHYTGQSVAIGVIEHSKRGCFVLE